METISQVVLPRTITGPVSTNWSRLVGLATGLNYVRVWATDFAGNRSPIVAVQITYRVIDPPNDFLASARVITNLVGTNSFNTLNATKEAGEPAHCGNLGGKSAWWRFSATNQGVLTLTTTNSTFDTLLAVYTGAAVGALTPVASNDDAAPGSGYSRLSFGVLPNTVYQIAVDGYDGAGSAGFLSYSFSPGSVLRLTVSSTSGGSVVPGTSDVASNSAVVLTATPSAGYRFDKWSGAVFSVENPLSVVVRSNMALTASFLPAEYTDGFESGGFNKLDWTFAGNAPWTIVSTNAAGGVYSARSGVIGDNQSSSLLVVSNRFAAGNGYFDYRISSEAGWDWLRFYVDGVLRQQWSGEGGWANFAFPLTAGSHTLEWLYSKDPAGSSGQDAAFIDNLILPLLPASGASTPARLSMTRQSDGDYIIIVQGQVNQIYTVQSSTNLVNWKTLATQTAYTGSFQVLDQGSATNTLRYYRAVAP